jgi:dolichol-phosphate mannosyltransferase
MVICVVIPCYRVSGQILRVLSRIGPEVGRIYVVDDCCPEQSGQLVQRECSDPRVRVLFHEQNQGVGGAMLTGYAQVLADGGEVIVKIDGDDQMDPALLPAFVDPIVRGEADYSKGNRFFDLSRIGSMPPVRIFGNAALSFLTKLSTGYWDIFDPTNGYTAIHAGVANLLPFEKVSRRYFFETDLLFRLGTFRAVVVDIPMDARYGDETSGLKVGRVVGEFMYKHVRNFSKRIFYNYYLRDLSAASIELAVGVGLMAFGIAYGGWHWLQSHDSNMVTPAGTVMLSAMPIILGLQLILAFLHYDIASVPRRVLRRRRPEARA